MLSDLGLVMPRQARGLFSSQRDLRFSIFDKLGGKWTVFKTLKKVVGTGKEGTGAKHSE